MYLGPASEGVGVAAFVALGASIVGVFLIDQATGSTLDLLPCFCIPVLIAATIASNRQVALLFLLATGCSILHVYTEFGSEKAVHVFLEAALFIVISLLAVWLTLGRTRALRLLKASELKYRLLVDNSINVVMRVGKDYKIIWISKSLSRILGWHPQEWINREPSEFLHPDDIFFTDEARQGLARGEAIHSRVRVINKQGDYHWVEVNASLFVNEIGENDGMVASFNVVDKQFQSEQELKLRARTDHLTGLFNRVEVLNRLDLINNKNTRAGKFTAVLFCDLDQFKNINDTYGHLVGDEVLCALADRIKISLRRSDLIARFGGDEFLIILEGVQDLENATVIAENIRVACFEPVVLISGPISTSVSIGVTLAQKGESSDSMISRADAAMYLAKKQGRNRVIPIPITGQASFG